MTASEPAVLIARHVEKLMSRPDRDKVQEVLARSGLTLRDGRVSHAGLGVTTEDSRNYKRAIREVYGEAVYAFTKVNFVLGGCTCNECVN